MQKWGLPVQFVSGFLAYAHILAKNIDKNVFGINVFVIIVY